MCVIIPSYLVKEPEALNISMQDIETLTQNTYFKVHLNFNTQAPKALWGRACIQLIGKPMNIQQ